MKKLLSCIAFVAISLGFSGLTFADTKIASAQYPLSSAYYLAPSCAWNVTFTLATPGGLLRTKTLVCSGVSIANYDYYDGIEAARMIGMINKGYKITLNSNPANTSATPTTNDYAIYKKDNITIPQTCPASQTKMVSGPFTDLTGASYSRGMYDYNNQYTNNCPAAQGCHYNIVAITSGYQVWCN